MVEVKVQPGDLVAKGQVVSVLSAMKMEMAVQSNVSGKVGTNCTLYTVRLVAYFSMF